MRKNSGAKSLCRLVFLIGIVALFGLAVMPGLAWASWSGSQTVTFELAEDGLVTHYMSVLEYSVNYDWVFTGIAFSHPEQGVSLDVSSTIYWRPFKQILYATIGVRRGVYRSQAPLVPYISVTYRF